MDENKTKVICLTPVRNEEWIIDKFLRATSIWADLIIVADNGSTDKTAEIASKFSKVIIVDNSNVKDYHEKNMRAPLFDEARKIPGKKLLIAADADEFLTPNFNDPEWKMMLEAPVGTRFIFKWCNIQPNLNSYLQIKSYSIYR